MSVLKIVCVPNPVLNKVSSNLEEITDETINLINNMKDTLKNSNGIGLAAPQVGINKRLIIIDFRNAEDIDENHIVRESEKKLIIMINPKITALSDTKLPMKEGCLSVPNIFTNITRPTELQVEYYDENNKLINMSADNLMAKCIQHEIDHLDGLTLLDHVSALKKQIILKKVKKYCKVNR